MPDKPLCDSCEARLRHHERWHHGNPDFPFEATYCEHTENIGFVIVDGKIGSPIIPYGPVTFREAENIVSLARERGVEWLQSLLS